MPAFSWTGCHVGIHAGGGWGSQTVDARSSGAIVGSSDVETDGGLFGGQVGCDREFIPGWVVGLEGDVAAAHLTGSGPDPYSPTDPANSIRTETEWLASVTARLGYTGLLPQTLVYVKGGAAWAHQEYTITSRVTGLNGEFDKTHSGWTVGAGFSWAISDKWSLFAEYNHYDFTGSGFSNSFSGISLPIAIDIEGPEIDTVKVGLNLRF
jgi:outer membrane immunogenic protein